ncbi:rhoptry protein ROP14, putative (ROP14) [Plasmodium malariae]|uniref:Rhoptry protein ROP14, putative (ROP14) n=1 Tax=Plasmodium malariae TaxID=5858 RepID=A0A1A8W806_PLAMA|nr:rhoptry protein ROP14, putative (ROP14) [Plasmodium malariae]
MEKNDINKSTKILINNKEIDSIQSLTTIKNYIKIFFEKTFIQNSTSSETFQYKSKALENTFWCAQIVSRGKSQNVALIGKDGLTPAREYVNRVFEELRGENVWTKFQNFHSLFWLLPVTDFVINLLPLVGECS